ncbi:hypothetical protein WJX74_006751 [Apatococcus lobatus]|uniref:NmrA-like domain-containing protein n=1 Tax=Apatococcus lobatus TaxID=904363 RepID=A0AAW1S615_9CHLO
MRLDSDVSGFPPRLRGLWPSTMAMHWENMDIKRSRTIQHALSDDLEPSVVMQLQPPMTDKGKQGRSAVNGLLDCGNFRVRGLARDLANPQVEHLQERGVEVVSGDHEILATVFAAAQGAYAAFVITHRPDETADAPTVKGKVVALACKEAGVQHFLWSTLSNSGAMSRGNISVPHWMQKARVDEYVESLRFRFHTFICPSLYYSIIQCGFARTTPDGIMHFSVPLSKSGVVTAFDVQDLGRVIPGIFERVTGKTAVIDAVNQDQFLKMATALPMPLRKSLALGFHMLNTHGYYPQDVDTNNAAQIVPSLTSWTG